MSKTEVNIKSLYQELQKCETKSDYDRAVTVCNKILSTDSSDSKAFQCKIVSLINLGKFEQVLNALKSSQHGKTMHFEKAYCEYRLNRTTDALKTLKSVSDSDRDLRCQELLGQVLYRLEDFSESYVIYRYLLKNCDEEFEEERKTNMAAVVASMSLWQNSPPKDTSILKRENTYELCFNAACYHIGQGDYKAAQGKLQQAIKVFEELNEEEEDVDESDLTGIWTQMGFVHQTLGSTQDARECYNKALQLKSTDAAVTAVLSNNAVAMNKDQNVFDSKKKMKAATASGLEHKLVTQQKESIAVNQCLLQLLGNQGQQCKQSVVELNKKYPGNHRPNIILAAQHMREKNMQQAQQVLKDLVEGEDGSPLEVALTLAQLYLGQGHIYQACDTLKKMGNCAYQLGVISALVSLYMSQEDRKAASDVLNDGVQWYRSNKPNSTDLQFLTKANANFQLKYGDPKIATRMLEEIYKTNPKDEKILAQLISAYSKFDPKKAQELSRKLPSAKALTSTTDVAALEASAFSFAPKYTKRTPKVEMSPGTPASDEHLLAKKKNKKKRKGKRPKSYDPNTTPDPERWLKKNERSYFKGKKKKNKKDIGKGSQGSAATSGAALELDATYTPPPVDTSSIVAPRQQKPQAGKQKKKKKK